MISDLDDSLTTLLNQELPPAIVSSTQISFEAPDERFPPTGVTLPAIDLFLYDVRENTDLRTTDWIVDQSGTGDLVKYPPPARVDCAYLVTAWPSDGSTSRANDEHRLLSEVMKVLLQFPILPETVLSGELAGQSPPLPAMSLGPGRLQSVAEFWQALGGKPKAALSLIVTIGVQVAQPADAGPPVKEGVFNVAVGVRTLPGPAARKGAPPSN